MLDPDHVERVESEMAEQDGQISLDDHEGVWECLKMCAERVDELEFAILPDEGVRGRSRGVDEERAVARDVAGGLFDAQALDRARVVLDNEAGASVELNGHVGSLRRGDPSEDCDERE